jgi:hypothetical protein
MNVPAKPPGADEEKSPWHREIPTHKEVFVGELAQNGDWIVANISTNSFWPVASQKVRWRGVDIWILPIMKGFYPAVAMLVPPGKSRAECEELVMRFLSMLSWVEERGFMVEGGGCGGGNLPRPMRRPGEGLLDLRRVRPELFPGGHRREGTARARFDARGPQP